MSAMYPMEQISRLRPGAHRPGRAAAGAEGGARLAGRRVLSWAHSQTRMRERHVAWTSKGFAPDAAPGRGVAVAGGGRSEEELRRLRYQILREIAACNKFDFIVSGEFQKYIDNDDIHFNTGAEAVYNKTFALRAGYQTGYEAKGFTAGIGVAWGSLNFDYAYTPFSLGLGNANQFSLQFSF